MRKYMVKDKNKIINENIPISFSEEDIKKVKLNISKINQPPRIKDVYYKKLIRHSDERGDLTELWSEPWIKNEPIAKKVKHVYYNTTHEGTIKGFHWHRSTYSQYTCVFGKMQIVLVDIRKNSPTFGYVDQYVIGTDNPSYIKIPPGVFKAWKSLKGNSVIVNLLTSANAEDNYKIPSDLLLKNIWCNE